MIPPHTYDVAYTVAYTYADAANLKIYIFNDITLLKRSENILDFLNTPLYDKNFIARIDRTHFSKINPAYSFWENNLINPALDGKLSSKIDELYNALFLLKDAQEVLSPSTN
jgi:hypothetical protein